MQNGGSQRTVIHTGIVPPKADEQRAKPKTIKPQKKAGFSERLLRNTAIACALLLGILTVRNIDAPWSQAAMTGIETALTMRIDPDSSLGRLSFVQSMIPESTLVFFNMSDTDPVAPVDGDVIHEYIAGQPWTLYSCDEGADVRSVLAGSVSAVMQLESGDWCVLIDHGDGVESMYAYLAKPLVDAGDQVARGETIGSANSDSMYYEFRRNGESVAE